ncbi:hypothetical protein ABT143_11510 [Streptomyces sp. NPDC002033]|uniref:hypothetical protein n=1 Tax=unclassified Streptomyces TaxID=2593676 RepID=UPI00331FECD9
MTRANSTSPPPWTAAHRQMLAQPAKTTRDQGLTALAGACHPQPLRLMRWTATMIKNLSPQFLTRR